MSSSRCTGRQSQKVADMVNSLMSGDRSIPELEELTGMEEEAIRRWVRAFEAVGRAKTGQPQETPAGRLRTTWTMQR